MFVEKHDIIPQPAWTRATSKTHWAVIAREETRYAAIRRQHIALFALTLTFCVLLLAVTGEPLSTLWPVLLFFALLWTASAAITLRARALNQHLKSAKILAAPCLCVAKEEIRQSQRKRAWAYHTYDYLVTVQFAERFLTALWTDPEAFARFQEQAPALLLRMEYKNRTYYDISPEH